MDQAVAHVYCHIPFCVHRCPFCSCVSMFSDEDLKGYDRMSNYVGAVCAEIAAFREPKAPLQSIVFGGGTPTLLRADHLEKLIDQIDRTFPQRVVKDFEMSFETTPELATPRTLRAFQSVGFNRVSIGVQSLSDTDLELLGRGHRREHAVRAYRTCREVGLDNINLDLMLGFPGHDMARWQNVVSETIELGPEHCSLNPMTIWHDGGPEYVDRLAGAGNKRPEFGIQVRMFEYACEQLVAAGYQRSTNLTYSKPGYPCVQGPASFGMVENIAGFGAGAYSKIGQRVLLNPPTIGEYVRDPLAPPSPIKESERIRHYMRMGILLRGRLDDEDSRELLGMPLKDAIRLDPITNIIAERMIDWSYGTWSGESFQIVPSRHHEAMVFVNGTNFFGRSVASTEQPECRS